MTLPDPQDQARLVARLLAAAREKSADVAAQVHPAWLQMAWQRIGIEPGPANTAAAGSRALAAAYRLKWSSLTSLRQRAHRLALLPRPQLLRALAIVALHADRDRVRQCIGRNLRAALVSCIGSTAHATLLAKQAAPARSGARCTAFTVSELELDALASHGYARVRQRGDWRSRTLLPWVRLALSPRSELEAASATHEGGAAADGDDPFDHLTHYLPEHAWLFGSPMDLALSASTMD